MRMRRFALVALVSLLMVAPAAFAWGPLGHSIVAKLAWDQLTPTAKSAVIRLLATQSPYITLQSVSSWPDQLRDYPDKQGLWDQTHRMHYVDIDNKHCTYAPPRVCSHGQCVVAALAHYEAILGNRSLPASERLQALKFVVHFVGDEHEPFHDYGPYKGGNTYKVTVFGHKGELHRVWDSGLIDTREMTWKPYAKFLEAQGPVQLPAAEPGVSAAVQVAEAGCKIARQAVPANHVVDKAYVRKWLPVADQQLRLGGARLAQVLNRILG
ncbi:MAG TPA: S1/P1 nuclease [Rhodanobacteraceae bacterium]